MRKSYLKSVIIRNILVRTLNKFDKLQGELNQFNGYTFWEKFIKLEQIKDLNAHDQYLKIIKALLSSERFANLIKNYISLPQLDLIRFNQSPKKNNNTNQSIWHHDSVGNRIKVYIGLSELTDKVGTFLIPGTHKNEYLDYAETRIVLNEEERSISPVFINLGKGDVFIFDTNILHKANYSKEEFRQVLELEFSNSIKGIILPGKIGRKRNKRISNLLDKKDFSLKLKKFKKDQKINWLKIK